LFFPNLISNKIRKINCILKRYEIISDSITVRDGLSSSWNEETYYFNYDKPDLTIKVGKFSPYIETNRSILTFRKIE